MLGVHVHLASPKGYRPAERVRRQAGEWRGTAPALRQFIDPRPRSAARRRVHRRLDVDGPGGRGAPSANGAFEPYQVNDALMARRAAARWFMHCLPAHRGEEVTADVIESPSLGGVRPGREPAARAEGAAAPLMAPRQGR